jgi:DNA repair protein RecN (Recombination protein N)
MLTHIQIRDLAIIDSIELELGPGMTVLTGETGAGKSILVDALVLATGGRAGAEVVRAGAERTEVSATFSLEPGSAIDAWFAEQALEHDGECVLRRLVGADGRSRGYVNGQAMSIQTIRQLGELLVEVHGQMEYQSLMRKSAQRDLLDRHGRHDELTQSVAALWKEVKAQREALRQAEAAALDRTARLELLRYHVEELNELALKPGEPDELLAERKRLSQGGRLASGAAEIAGLLFESDSGAAEPSLVRALGAARTLSALDARLEPIAGLIDESLIALREASESLRRYQSGLDADPSRQEWLENRLAAMEAAARKHRVDAAALPALHVTLQEELQRLLNLEVTLDRLQRQLADGESRWQLECARLTAARQSAALGLKERVSALMQQLGMPGGRLTIDVAPLGPENAGEHGADEIEFLVAANPGQPPKPLAKVASGGELSRISLAIQVAAVESARLPCLVFDEVDAGIGGGVAEIVGRQLRTLSDRAQVLCVTHLPQVASQAQNHVRVAKLTDGRTTRTTLTGLSAADRVEEIARMLGGVEITERAREHAAEMLREGLARPAAKKSSGRRR